MQVADLFVPTVDLYIDLTRGEAAGEVGDEDARQPDEGLPRAQVRVLLAALGPRLGGEGGGGGELLLARVRVRAQG